MTTEAGIYRHDKNHVQIGKNVLNAVERRSRIQGCTWLGPEFPDPLNHPMQVDGCFRMYAQPFGPGVREGLDVDFGPFDHKMHIQRKRRRFSDSPHDVGPDGDVGHEMAVHHVHVNPVRPGTLDCFDLLGEPAEVRGKNGGCKFFHLSSLDARTLNSLYRRIRALVELS